VNKKDKNRRANIVSIATNRKIMKHVSLSCGPNIKLM